METLGYYANELIYLG